MSRIETAAYIVLLLIGALAIGPAWSALTRWSRNRTLEWPTLRDRMGLYEWAFSKLLLEGES